MSYILILTGVNCLYLKKINLNGTLLPGTDISISSHNSAFRSGLGLVETMLLSDGILPFKHYHWERLNEALVLTGFDYRAELFVQLEYEIASTLKANGLDGTARVRLQVFGDLLRSTPRMQPQFMIECLPLAQDVLSLNTAGWRVGIAGGLSKTADAVSHLKTTNALIYTLAGQQAARQGLDDMLICNSSGRIIESTIANIFWIRDNRIYTPPLSEGCVGGVMRRFLIDSLPQKGYEIQEAALDMETLEQADEVFLTNAVRKIRWVSSISGRNYGLQLVSAIYNTVFD